MPSAVIFDLDGTLYRGHTALPGAQDAVESLRRAGLSVRFLTNNSSLSRTMLVDKLERLGFIAEPEEVYGTAMAAAQWAQEHRVAQAAVIGEAGLFESLLEVGVHVIDPRETTRVDAVFVGICRTFDYTMLDGALQHLAAGADFVATNTDATYPLEAGREAPGAGSIVAAVQAVAGRPPLVLGKPEPKMVLDLIRQGGWNAADVWVVGDRLETDIEAGSRAGCPTYLVLSGVSTTAPQGQPAGADIAAFARDLLK